MNEVVSLDVLSVYCGSLTRFPHPRGLINSRGIRVPNYVGAHELAERSNRRPILSITGPNARTNMLYE